VTLEFLEPDRATSASGFDPVASSVLEPHARAAGAQFELRERWRVAVHFGSVEREVAACRSAVGVGDLSRLGKLELQGGAPELAETVAAGTRGAELELGCALRIEQAWWCPFSRERVLVVCAPEAVTALRGALEQATAQRAVNVIDLTCGLAALALVGPRARDALARLTAIDLRPARMPEAGFRPGSVARVAGTVLRERGDHYLLMFGSAYAQYMWQQVIDAAALLGGRPVGTDALGRVSEEVSPLA